jgi:hypothetical protein
MFKFILLSLQSTLSILRILKDSDFFAHNKLGEFHNHKSHLIRILGNGSSLNETIGSFTDKYDYMVVNRHVLSFSYTEIKPKYYVLADPHFFNHEEGLDIFQKIKDNTYWSMTLLIRFSNENKKFIKTFFKDNKNITVLFFNATPFNGFKSAKYFFYRHGLAIPLVQNVMVAAIYVAIRLKYQNIELYGVEHSWTKHLSVNADNKVCLKNPHFYDKNNAKVQTWTDIQHEDAHLCDVLRMYANMFESYLDLAAFAKIQNANILNCTKDSFIDAFERK